MEKDLAECLAANRIYRISEGGITMLRKLFDSRRKVATVAALVALVAATAALGLSGAVGLTNGKAPVSVTSSAVPIFTESSLPPAVAFEQLAPFDVVVEAKDWKLIDSVAARLGFTIPTDYVQDIQGFAILRVEKDGKISVRAAPLRMLTSIPVADEQGNLSFVPSELTVVAVSDQPVRYRTSTGEHIATNIGKIDEEGFFSLPWILTVKSDKFPEPFTVYLHTWGFLGKDIIIPGRSYADFGTTFAVRDVPPAVQKGIDLLRQKRFAAGLFSNLDAELGFSTKCNCNGCNKFSEASETFLRKFLSNLHKIPEEWHKDIQTSLPFVLQLIQGKR